MKIRPPRFDSTHPDYQLECEAAMEDAMRELIDVAGQAGWRPKAIFPALASLVENQRLAYAEDPDPAED